jgi:hypothetical protein
MEHVEKIANTLKLKSVTSKDPDVLIVGDYNSYSAENPITYLKEQGYTEELVKYDPEGYSYRWDHNNRAPAFGYLDHVMANASMSKQVVGAKAWHINTTYKDADYSFKKSTNTEMYRYSDHDPVIVGLKLYTVPSSVFSIETPHTVVRVEGGTVRVEGANDEISIWTLTGTLVGTVDATDQFPLPQGFYIIKADNDIHKVIIQ